MTRGSEIPDAAERLLEAVSRPRSGKDWIEKAEPSGSALVDGFAWFATNGLQARWLVVCREIWDWLLTYSSLPQLLDGMPEGELWGAKVVFVEEPKVVLLDESLEYRVFIVSR